MVTERRYVDQEITDENWYLKNIFHEDFLLSNALAKHGFQAKRVDWCDPEIEWPEYRAIVIRTTWDYFHRFDEFTAWLAERQKDSTVLNAPAQLQWNMDKHYLHDLQEKQISIVPTWYLEKGEPYNVEDLLSKLACEEAVLKPCISGAARHTYRLRSDDRQAWERYLAELTQQESMLVQPFQRRIVEEGEITLVAFDGNVTHAVRKVAKAGDFRVQDDHGGTVYPHQPLEEEIEFAERAMRACSPTPVYGRVDIVRSDSGEMQLMELELVEPELWMRFAPESADRFAEAVVSRLKNNSFNR